MISVLPDNESSDLLHDLRDIAEQAAWKHWSIRTVIIKSVAYMEPFLNDRTELVHSFAEEDLLVMAQEINDLVLE